MYITFLLLFPVLLVIAVLIIMAVETKGKVCGIKNRFKKKEVQEIPDETTSAYLYARIEVLKYDLGDFILRKFPNCDWWTFAMNDISLVPFAQELRIRIHEIRDYRIITVIKVAEREFMLMEEYNLTQEQKQEQKKEETPSEKVDKWLNNNFNLIYTLTEEAKQEEKNSITIPSENVDKDMNMETLIFTLQDKGYEQIFCNEDGSITLILPIENN